MLKRKTALLLVSLAYAIQLGHNIIPHHHHHEDHHHHSGNHHHHHNDAHLPRGHHHDEDEENNLLNNIFSHFFHLADCINYTTSCNSTYQTLKVPVQPVAILPVVNSFDEIVIPIIKHSPTKDKPFCISPHPGSSGLRGPPVKSV